ncbi:hypothetical protein ACJIZ3_019382 [Penstemon smallii]|uniref:BHLH domain-containing protein n=1 Tax=Penstemon smallii TaxID=265156 RepID=A0ABD3T1J0_9LAMI
MDLGKKDTNVGPPPQNTTHMSSNWQVNGNNSLTSSSTGMIQIGNSMVESSACSSAPMVDSFWDPQSLAYTDLNVQNVTSTSTSLGPLRANMNWTPNAMFPQSLPHFPSDSAFIERAARFSCFNGGSFGEMMNPFSTPDPLHPYSRILGGPNEVFGGNPRHEMNMTTNVSKEASPLKNEKKSECLVREEGKRVSGNESDEAEFSGRGAQEESSGKGLIGSKKRKRNGKDTTSEYNENNEETGEITKQKGDQNPTSTGKSSGKNGKQGSQGSDTPKEDYIHIRARRGQATNSHSLAERVRREKISERMKFLQDLVPGCSKVTGKAVMLDEIINYVQSLQRQVEFLSMKLATVNPRLDFNVEGLLAKDILQSRAGPSSSLAFPHDMMAMPFPQLHPSQTGLIQTGLSGLGTSSEIIRRPFNLQSTTAQVPSSWEDELHNVIHMGGFNTNAALNSQDLSASLPPGHMKAEP